MSRPRFRWSAVAIGILVCTLSGSGCDSSQPLDPGVFVQPVYPTAQEQPDWSRQGEIVYVDNGISCVDSVSGLYQIDTSKAGLWVLDPQTSITRRVTAFPYRTPSWNPSGQRLAFATPYSGAIFTMAVDGSDLQQVTAPNGSFAPRWSLDGARLTWAQRYCPGCGVYVGGIDGDSARLVLSEGDSPDWDPNSLDTLVCTLWDSAGTGQGIVAVSASTGGYRTLLPSVRGARIRSTRYSPDGYSIAFLRIDGTPGPPGLYVLRRGDAAPRLLHSRAGEDCSWSPAGDRIAYVESNSAVYSAANGTIWSIEVSSGKREQLTHWWPSVCDSARATLTAAESYSRPQSPPAPPCRRRAARASPAR